MKKDKFESIVRKLRNVDNYTRIKLYKLSNLTDVERSDYAKWIKERYD